MKISEYKDEAALDKLADILEPATEIMSDEEIAKILQTKRPIDAVKLLIKNHKKAVIEILAVLDDVPVEEYHCNIFTLPIKLVEVLNDKELMGFFSSQGQLNATKSFGSVTEVTQGAER